MCGFSCYFHFDTPDGVYPDLDLDSFLQYIQHRGPDSREKFTSPCGRCALGHVRLSVIDLAGGQQPMSNESDSVHTVVNGELYDFECIRPQLQSDRHKFKTLSDNLSFLEHLRGEFALCIWDQKKNRFIAARDRYGIKPLFYIVSNGTLLVASEIKAFISMGWKAEWDIDSVLNNGPYFDNRTCFKGVHKLPPAHYLIATSTGSIEFRQYWDAEHPHKNVKDTRTLDETIQGIRERLTEAVRHRLRADVPLGVYLSDGIDSSSIAGIASDLLRKQNPNVRMRAFSVSFKGSDKYDESPIAERTAEFCNADFQKLSLTEDDLLGNFEESIWYSEQTQFNLNGVGKFTLSAFVRDQGCKVVLTGEGSDEHFSGYAFFQGGYLRELDRAGPDGFGTLPDEQREARLKLFGTQGKFIVYMDEVISSKDTFVEDNLMLNDINSHALLAKALRLGANYYSDAAIAQCGTPNADLVMVESINGARSKANVKWHPLHTALYVEDRTFLPNYLCNLIGDRGEMAHSLEARTPFLDPQLCEYVNSLPPSLKIKSESDGTLNEKWVLKEVVKSYITEEIYKRTKHPYIAPSSKGHNPMLVSLMNRVLSKENIEKLGWVNYEKFKEAKELYLETSNQGIFKDIMMMVSYVVISHRFNVSTYGVPKAVVAR